MLRAFDVVYFAASVDDAETNRKFAESVDADYPILSDPTKEVAQRYGVLAGGRPFASRWTFYIGPDGRILDIDTQVKASTAGEDIVAKLKSLGVAQRKPSV